MNSTTYLGQCLDDLSKHYCPRAYFRLLVFWIGQLMALCLCDRSKGINGKGPLLLRELTDKSAKNAPVSHQDVDNGGMS